jgi:DNA-binding LacI/PurR family transcriptional regulator
MATIYDVAKRAGVSIATVSAVLNKNKFVSDELTNRVQDAAAALDYQINHLARSVQLGSSRTIGMLIPAFATPDPFYAQVVRGAEDVLSRRNYALLLGQTYNDLERQSQYLQAFRARLVDGVLIFQSSGDDPELHKFLRQRKPLVFVGRVPENLDADIAATDIMTGTRMAVEHLVQRGHKRVALLTVASSTSVHRNRVEGWRQALHAHNLPARDEYQCSSALSAAGAREATKKLLNLSPRITAIFADNLLLVTGILQMLRERKITCPGELEVMSSDDAEWLDVFEPSISTVVQPSYELGCTAADLLLKRLRHPKRKFTKILLQPSLKIRTPR